MEGEHRLMERERKGRARPEHGLQPFLTKLGLVTVVKSGGIKVAWREIGITVLLVEQNANKALHMAHYGYVLETGRITLMDEAKKLLQNDHVRRSYLGE